MSVTSDRLQTIVSNVKKASILKALERGVRLDNRKPDEYRPLSITLGYAKKADGSALVKLGDTMVLAGTKLEMDEPFPDTPNQGNLMVNVELLPLAYETFEPGPPDENAIELARVVDRSLRDSKAVDLSKLVIIPGKKVWSLWVDVYVLDFAGNVMDASTIAAVAAIYNTKLPKVEVNGEEVKVLTERTDVTPLAYPVVTLTAAKIGNFVVIDPNLEEESIADAKLSISYTPDMRIVGIQKSLGRAIKLEEIPQIEEVTRKAASRLFSELKNAFGIA
ncbi:MAG: exosome complex protein Rrp42 [Sulfolobaceae archaeon]|jgi:ribosomal RNA-processing protein RRP42 (EC 3.1.13.-)|nr:exosome complex protein Rrp42 [Sulfolobales archaeon]